MERNKRTFRTWASLLVSAGLIFTGCGSEASSSSGTSSSGTGTESASTLSTGEVSTDLSRIDMTKWSYNSDDDVYYQIGIRYAENSPDESYDSLAVFVPGAYFEATDNGDGTFTCAISGDAEVSGYTAETAPIVFPVNTPGYSAQEELTDYTDVSEYTDAGFIYVHVGARGRDAGAPAGVTDFKAAIRYIRYNSGVIAGDTDNLFVFGMSGGGAQSAILGSTGDSSMYDAYLEEIGAVEGVSDAVCGAALWCPITSLDEADEAYEWNMGSTRTGLSDEEQSISDALAEAYAEYVNQAGFVDENGNTLTLEESEEGIDQSGSYYDYIKSVIEDSLNSFLQNTTFPYDASASSESGAGDTGTGGAPSGEMPSGEAPSGEVASGSSSSAGADAGLSVQEEMNSSSQNDGIARSSSASSGLDLSGTYETAQDYIDALNADGEWVTYDASSNMATISSVADFASAMKNASKDLGAFDQLDAGQGENTLFGTGDGEGAHFDATLCEILESLGSDYADDYADDLQQTDSAGNTTEYRVNMYSPLYYLLSSEDGYQSSAVAKHWRIRSGISQGDTSLCTEVNLSLALQNYEGVEDVDFATVWGQGHTMAEESGDSTSNFIEWVNECVQSEA